MSTDEHAANARGMKVHLRLVRVGARVFRVIGLRLSSPARFSTNLFHHTWHVLTDGAGARVLARLLWGLAYQRKPDTIVVISRPHLVPTPFEGDAPDPIVVVTTDLGGVDGKTLRVVRTRLVRARIENTVRFQTFGLANEEHATRRWERIDEHVVRLGGCICYAASSAALRASARHVHAMRGCRGAEMDYHFLGDGRRWYHAEGEVQVFGDFRDKVSGARVARRLHGATIRDEGEREAIWNEARRRLEAVRIARSVQS